MTNKNSKTRKFNKMSYREVQCANSKERSKLQKEDQKWLKDNAYRNVGWDNVINLYEKTKEFLDKYRLEDLTIEELFLEADRIGNKYLTSQEIEEFNQRLAKEVEEINDEIDKQFPDTEIEIIDFSGKTNNVSRKNHKLHKTSKF
jgi:C-terminal processing protease CtpA/Prc